MKRRSSCLSRLNFVIPVLLSAIFLALTPSRSTAGTWTNLVNQAPGGVSLMLLLTDGTVICQNSGNTGWYKLTPDAHGSYVNGTWSTIASMTYSRRYYSSEVLENGNVFVAGGEYGSGGPYSEIYNPSNNTWTVTPDAPGVDNFIDSISETTPNGNVLISPVSPVSYGGTVIWNAASNSWQTGPTLYRGDDQDEAAWVKLADESILTIDPFGTNSERYIPSLNKWINDANVPTVMYGYGGELGPGFLLPNGNAFFIGGTNHTAIYTPSGTTNMGTWTAGPNIPNNNAAVDAPAAMMANGNVLCAVGPDTGYLSPTYFYEYNYISNAFFQVTAPGGSLSNNVVPYGCSLLDLPDGSILFSGTGSQLYDYIPAGSPPTNGIPSIQTVTTNADGSFLVTGTLLNGISEGAAYGDDEQMYSDYPVARITNSAGHTLYCKTYNWSVYNPMTGTNLVTAEMMLPAGLLPGTYPLVVTANGIASPPYSLASGGTPLPPVTGLAFSTVTSNSVSFTWNLIGSTETGYVVERSTNGINFSIIASLGVTITNYTDNTVTPFTPYYYQVVGTNVVGLGNTATIFAASPTVAPLPSPWSSGDIGFVGGSGASATNTAGFTLIGSGAGVNATNDAGQYAWQPVAGDVTITARVTAIQNTGPNALAGVMLRSSQGASVPDVMVGFNPAAQSVQFQSRTNAGTGAIVVNGSSGLAAPYWVRLTRSGNTITGYSSPDGNTWTEQGSINLPLDPVVDVGLVVTSGNNNFLNTATFDNVTLSGTTSPLPIPLAEWKLDETVGSVANDSVGNFDGTYNNVTLGLPGATPDTGYSAGFNGTNANITIPPLNLNSNAVTITAWINPAGNQNAWSGIFFDRESSTANGLTFGTANELRYTWNNNASTYNWNSGLVPPSNQWTFVALVIRPTQAAIYMITNGVLIAATNNVANPVQGFAGDSCIGQDTTSSSRYINGALDEVQFFNQSLTPAQLNDLAVTPAIAFTTPTNGQEFLPPASVNLSMTTSGTSGHTINLVQFFENGNLTGEATSAPYTNAVTNLAIGTYTFSAVMYYDSSLAVVSDPTMVTVETAPSTPTVTATAMASNLVYVAWTPATGANGYELSRSGTIIATFPASSTNFYEDSGVSGGVDYCYEVIATNQVGSATSVSSCVTTPNTTGSLTWDASGSASGPQDGSGVWNSSGVTWWNGSTSTTWANGSLAVFGAGTTTNCSVGIASLVAPRAFIFNPTTGGTYTFTNDGDTLTLSNQTVVMAYSNAVFDVGLSGAGGLVKAGNGTLTLEVANTDTGGLTVNAGMVVGAAPNGTAYGSTGNGNLTVNDGGIMEASGDNSLVGQTTSASKTITINAGGMITNTATSSCHLNALVLNGGTLAADSANGTYGNWNFDYGVSTLGNTNVSYIGGGNASVSESGGANFKILAGDTVIVSTVLGSVGSDNGLIKSGAGTLILQAVNTFIAATTVSNGVLQVDGSLATNTVTVYGGTLAGTGVINGATTVQSGGTLAPGDAGGIGTLAVSNSLTLNSGSTTLMSVGIINGILNNDAVLVGGVLTQGGTLVVTNVGNFALTAGSSFQLFAAGGFSGSFSTITLPALSAGLTWNTSQLAGSGIISVAYQNPAPMPAFSPGPGNYLGAQTVTLSSTNTGATIYYTTNGTTPNGSSPNGASPVTIMVPANAADFVISAYATASGYSSSPVTNATYNTIALPVWASPAGGSWQNSANWSNNVIANAAGVSADFSELTLPANADVTLDGSVTVGQLIFGDRGNAYNWELDPGTNGTLTLNNGTNTPVITVVNQTNTLTAALTGVNGVVKNGNGTLILTVDAPALTNGIVINAGELQITADNFAGQFTPSTITINTNGTLLGNNYHALGGGTAVIINHGTWLMNYEDYKQNLAMMDGLIAPGGGGDGQGLRVGFDGAGGTWTWYVSNSIAGSVINAPIDAISGTTLILSVQRGAAASDLTINGQVSGSGNLVFTGNGITILATNDTYTGTTIVSNGTLVVNGSLGTNTLTVASPATLSGTGTLNGATTVQSGGTLSPGSSGLGTLTASNSVTLAGTVAISLTNTGSAWTNGELAGYGTLACGGSLVVSNLSTNALAAGNSFKLFNAASYSGAFATLTLPALPAGLNWYTNNLAVNGTLSVSNNSLPAPWTSGKVGTSAVTNSAIYSSGVYTVQGSGLGLTNKLDNFWFVSQATGASNAAIIAEITSQQTNGNSPLAGVMIRQSAVTNSTFAFLGLTAGHGARWIDRTATNSNASFTSFPGDAAPYWVCVSRGTNTFTSFLSTNGTTWTEAASVTITGMTTNALIGLAVSSGNSNILNTAVFSSVTVTNQAFTQGNPPPQGTGVSQFENFAAGDGIVSFTVTGSGLWTLETSTNLVDWTSLGEEMNIINGSVDHSQNDDGGVTRFYQLVPGQ